MFARAASVSGRTPGLPPVISAPVFSAQSAPAGNTSAGYSYTFMASGSPTFALGTGTLPTGLTLSSGGVLSGTPTSATSFTFTVVASNAGGSTSSTSQTVLISSSSGLLPNLPTVGTPVIDKFEVISSSGSTTQSYWGAHQPRITRHADGSIRALVLVGSTNHAVYKKNGDEGTWSLEHSASGTDDAYLLRDPVSDAAVVVYDDPTDRISIRTSPSFAKTVFPSNWIYDGRDYAGVGMGSDGTLVYKQSNEVIGGSSNTNNTAMEINSGKLVSGSWVFNSSTKMMKTIGRRHGYDYIFPNTATNQVTSMAVIDMNIPQVTDYSLSGYGGFQYIFNGIHTYRFGYSSVSGALETLTVPWMTPANNSTCPERRQVDGFIDSSGQLFASYQQAVNRDSYGSNGADGFYTTLASADGTAISTKFWNILPNYGKIRIIQDGSGQYWLIWSNSGSSPQFRIYPMTISSGVMSASSFTDIAGPLISAGVNMNDNSTFYITSPRGGNPYRNYVDGIVITPSANNFAHYYFRLRLPG